ncbi:MAG: DUF58 domain-containing protein [Gemmataceae bacterium]|nr:DUF58 domain-containing protein [Gemmataceae bacterium]
MRWVVGIVVIYLAAWLMNSAPLAFAGYCLAGVFATSKLLAFWWSRGLVIKRKMRCKIAEVGDKVRVKITLQYRGIIPIPWLIIEDVLPADAINPRHPFLKVKGKPLKVYSLFSMQTVEFSYQLECMHRGFFQIGPVLVETGDPFGLHRRFRVACQPLSLLVLPKITPLLGYDLTSRRPIGEIRMTMKIFEDPTRIAGIRDYEPGDPFSRIHWKASARTGVFQSKIFEPTCLAGAMVLLDFHDSCFPPRGEPYRSELAISAALALAHAVCSLNQPFGLGTNAIDAAKEIKTDESDHELESRGATREFTLRTDVPHHLQPMFLPSRRGLDHLQILREMLGRALKTEGLRFVEMIHELSPHLPRDLSLVAVLPHVTEETAMTIGNLRQQGFAVSAILIQMDDESLHRSFKRLVANGVREIRHAPTAELLPQLCRSQVDRTSPLSLA